MTNRLSQSFINELLSRVDIINVIEAHVPLKKTGVNYKAKCPFHQEKTPSFTVSHAKQIYHCFGCGASGNAITFLMNHEHMSFMEAVESLASQAGIPIPNDVTWDKNQSSASLSCYDILEQAALFYQANLKKYPQALAYLEKRALNTESIQYFRLGYAPPGWDNLLKALGKDNESRQLLSTTGLLSQNEKQSTYDRFRDRIIFPIRDRRGRVIAFGGRVLSNENTPKYLNSPETPVFHKGNELFGLFEARQANRNLERLIVVEGYMDVIALAQHDITYAVATLGTATSAQHIHQLFRTSSEVVFCFDGDQAGLAAAWHALEILMPILRDDWQAKFMFLPKDEDPDSLIRKEGTSSFEARIQNAVTFSTFFLEELAKKANLDQLDGRAKLVTLTAPYIKSMKAEIMREMIINELSKKAKLTVEKLYKHVTDEMDQTEHPKVEQKTDNIVQPNTIRTLTMLLLQQPSLITQVTQDLPNLDIPGIALLRELIQLLQTNQSFSTGSILEHWRDKPESSYLIKLANYDHMISNNNQVQHFQDTLGSLQKQSITMTIENLLNKNRTTGLTDEEKKTVQNLLKKKQNL